MIATDRRSGRSKGGQRLYREGSGRVLVGPPETTGYFGLMPQRDNNVFLGLRGSGKASASPLLAPRLGRALVDLDDVTVAVIRTKSVPEAWSRFGKEAFRVAEAATLRQRLGMAEPFGKPSVTLENPSVEIKTVLAQRDPLFVKLGDHVIDVDALGVDEVVRRVAEALGADGTMGEVRPKPTADAVSGSGVGDAGQ